jgi:hypothetical protein
VNYDLATLLQLLGAKEYELNALRMRVAEIEAAATPEIPAPEATPE